MNVFLILFTQKKINKKKERTNRWPLSRETLVVEDLSWAVVVAVVVVAVVVVVVVAAAAVVEPCTTCLFIVRRRRNCGETTTKENKKKTKKNQKKKQEICPVFLSLGERLLIKRPSCAVPRRPFLLFDVSFNGPLLQHLFIKKKEEENKQKTRYNPVKPKKKNNPAPLAINPGNFQRTAIQ